MSSVVGSLVGDGEAPASCTRLACGTDCVVAVGLCGRLRAWHRATADADAGWRLVVDESSSYELANSHRSSHPYRYLSAIAPDGRFAVATTASGGEVALWSTHTWKQVQLVDPAESEADRAEREARGVHKLRAEHSCLAFAHDHLATGSREGHVRLWRAVLTKAADGTATGRGGGALKRRFGTLVGDDGPLAAVVLTPHLVLGVYRASSGLVDGNEYDGGQSVCAWCLQSGSLLWKHAPKLPAPAVGALSVAERLVILHGPLGTGADADWNLVLGPATPSGAAAAAAKASVLLRSTVVSGTSDDVEAEKGGREWQSLKRSALADGVGRLLAWHACDDGDGGDGGAQPNRALLALGFVGGTVSLLLAAAGSPAAKSQSDPFVTCSGAATGADSDADIGAVCVVPPRLLAESGAGWRAGLLAADAAGSVRLWALRRAADESNQIEGLRPLECLRALVLAPALQPCCLGLVGLDTLVCGCVDGRLIAVAMPLTKLEGGGKAAIGSTNGAVDVSDGGEHSDNEPLAEYEWCFDSGAGPQGRGTVRAKRRAFDGWAKTLAFETGLQQVLAKMNSQRGSQQLSGHGSASTGPSVTTTGNGSAPKRSTPRFEWKRGMHVKLDGLAARPELNGSIGMLLDGVDEGSGRAPVRLISPKEREGQALKVKAANLRLVT